MELSVILFFVL